MKHTPPAIYFVSALALAACLSGCGQKGDLYLEAEQETQAVQEVEEDDGDDDKD